MATGSQRRTRSERVAAIELPPGLWRRLFASLRRGEVLLRIAMCITAAVAMCAVIRGWHPPFPYRAGHVPQRNIVARLAFEAVNEKKTKDAQDYARRQVRYVYVRDPQALKRASDKLETTINDVVASDAYAASLWTDFQAPPGENAPSEQESREQFTRFHDAVADPKTRAKLLDGVNELLAPYRDHGLLLSMPQKPGQGNRDEIIVYTAEQPDNRKVTKVGDVLFDMGDGLRRGLRQQLGSDDLVEPLFHWLRRNVNPTLSKDDPETTRALDAALAAVPDVVDKFGRDEVLVEAGQSLGPEQLSILRQEHEAHLARRTTGEMFARGGAVVAMILALFGLSAAYIRRHERRLASSTWQIALMLALAVLTVRLSTWASDAWRTEIIPLLLFAQIVAIVYRQELALLLSGVVALILALALSYLMSTLLLMVGVTATAVLQLSGIRTRTKLIYVGLFAGIVAFMLTIGLAVLDNQPIGQPLLLIALCNALWTVAAGFLMTGLLPFIEHLFGVLTDISLLELGDVSHALLQELVRRAPSTYNHSITVGSIAEAAAEAISARGLLTRVGAYYHDIGKMLKPGYFIENQRDDNVHESLVPAMSTLIIIAHVKDGADLARQHGLPQPIIDFIEQHHGTTLVEYFYGRAQRQNEPDGPEVEESSFRYPGPKPQTREAGVLMLADSVESASRSLVDPAPSRIESLVREIAERKLDDGQFDESGLTLRELRMIEDSMIKSLIANYHGRVKYPEQRTA